MISVIMPYWKRRDALIRTLKSYGNYQDIDYVIVDDGSGDDIPAKIRLPLKTVAKNPCVPINTGVNAADGDIIVITGPEITHRFPILGEMEKSLKEFGDRGYVTAAALGQNGWHCHSSVNGKRDETWPVPKGAGFHFCAMMYKKFFLEIGGFDEAYREGQAFDDNDFLWTLHKNNAVFCMRDDLVVDHHNVKSQWPEGGWERNRIYFENKWKDYINEHNKL